MRQEEKNTREEERGKKQYHVVVRM